MSRSGVTQIASVPRIALRREDAAEALGMSLTTFEQRVQPYIALIPCGRKRLVPVEELQRWDRESRERPMVEQLREAA